MKSVLITLQSGTEYLSKKGVDEARLNMEHLLAHVLGCRRLDLYLRFDEILNEIALAPLRTLVKRRSEGEPLQHLLGTVEFFDSEFVSDERALIPRPETEGLVEQVIKSYGAQAPGSVLDVGTGSGCIGLSLAKAWPQAEVTLIDVSEDALELARLNAERLQLPAVKLFRSHLFEKLEGARFDLIIANLPYIPSGEIAELSREVKRDPILALDGGDDGLDLIRDLIAQSPEHLNSSGRLVLEFHHDQAKKVTEYLQNAGFEGIQITSDFAEIPRFSFASLPLTLS